jgi:hypothetical protein
MPKQGIQLNTTSRGPASPLVAAIFLLISSTLIGGCGSQSFEGSAGSAADQEQATVKPVFRSYRFDERAEFIDDMATELAAITRDAERIFPDVVAAGQRTRTEVIPILESLRARSGSLYRRLDEARSGIAADWPSLTDGFARDLARLKSSLEGLRLEIAGSATVK